MHGTKCIIHVYTIHLLKPTSPLTPTPRPGAKVHGAAAGAALQLAAGRRTHRGQLRHPRRAANVRWTGRGSMGLEEATAPLTPEIKHPN